MQKQKQLEEERVAKESAKLLKKQEKEVMLAALKEEKLRKKEQRASEASSKETQKKQKKLELVNLAATQEGGTAEANPETPKQKPAAKQMDLKKVKAEISTAVVGKAGPKSSGKKRLADQVVKKPHLEGTAASTKSSLKDANSTSQKKREDKAESKQEKKATPKPFMLDSN